MVVIIPMAGQGSRFRAKGFDEPKPLIKVNGLTLIEHSVMTLGVEGKYIFITKKYDNEKYNLELNKVFDRIAPHHVEIKIDHNTRGSVDSALKAVPFLNGNDPVIETNCDQHLVWSGKAFVDFCKSSNCDGAVVTYPSDNLKDSYALIENNKIVKIVEKEIISNDALIGVHYWKKAKDFISSSTKLLKDKIGETYISETYNYLIQEGKTILPYKIDYNQFKCLGTPELVNIFKSEAL